MEVFPEGNLGKPGMKYIAVTWIKKKEISTDLDKDIKVWKSLIRNSPNHVSMENRRYSKYDDDEGQYNQKQNQSPRGVL